MAKATSAEGFSTAFIPLVMNLLFAGLNQVKKSQDVTLLQMGQAQYTLPWNPPYNPAFGSWLNSNPAFASLGNNFTLIEMNGLYGALLNASKFGPFTNPTLLKKCTAGNLNIQCGLSLNLITLLNPLANALLKGQAVGFLNELLCPSLTLACFNTSNPLSLPAVGAFVMELSKYVLWYLDSNNYGLTTTRKQSEITLGYVMDKLPFPGYSSGIRVPGTVTWYANETDAEKLGTNSTFYTCESTEGDRFTWAGKLNTVVPTVGCI